MSNTSYLDANKVGIVYLQLVTKQVSKIEVQVHSRDNALLLSFPVTVAVLKQCSDTSSQCTYTHNSGVYLKAKWHCCVWWKHRCRCPYLPDCCDKEYCFFTFACGLLLPRLAKTSPVKLLNVFILTEIQSAFYRI